MDVSLDLGSTGAELGLNLGSSHFGQWEGKSSNSRLDRGNDVEVIHRGSIIGG